MPVLLGMISRNVCCRTAAAARQPLNSMTQLAGVVLFNLNLPDDRHYGPDDLLVQWHLLS